MNKYTLLIATLLVVIPFIPFGSVYWYATTLKEIDSDYPSDEFIEHIKSINDVSEVKRIALSEMESTQKAFKDDIELYFSLASGFLWLGICNAVFLYMFYRRCSCKNYNKSSKPTAKSALA